MVLIIKKITAKRGDLIFIPKAPLFDMLIRHVSRSGLAPRLNTCIVSPKNSWTGKPGYKEVVALLIETLKLQRVIEGEKKYPMPHHLFANLKCRNFDSQGNPASPPFEGDFIINFIRIRGRHKLLVEKAGRFEKIGFLQKLSIRNLFRKMEGRCAEEFVFLAVHIHPAARR